jgi:aldehyde dehydrogenase (NAD+)
MANAVAAARAPFDSTSWSTDTELRKRCIDQLQAGLESEQEELRQDLVAEVGTPIALTYGPQLDAPLREALSWPRKMIDQFEWSRSLGAADALGWGMQTERVVWKEPKGVIAAIVPWNFPIELTLTKLGPILAMGNTCILKPAPDTPWNATRIARVVAEKTEIPPGVINVVPSRDHMVGEVLTKSPDVDMIAFTGSTATGRRIMEASASTVKDVFLELGGKSAVVVLDDAPLDQVMATAAMACIHGGQACAQASRMLVPRSRYDEAIELAEASFKNWKYGDPTVFENMQGPQVNKRQQGRVLELLASAPAQGARVIFGGGRPSHLEKGFYVEPTLFADVTNDMRIAQEEVFGPVLSLIPYEGDDEAVRIANDSSYGLAGAVHGEHDHALAVARRIRTGTLSINGGVWYGADAPFGGYKMSGIGRQCGIEGLEIFTETKLLGWPEGSESH